MQGHVSKLSYTLKQRKEFLRTWTAIGCAHVSSSHGPDLLQLLDIASTSLVADHDCNDYRPLYTAHLLPAGSTLYTPNATDIIPTSKPPVTSTSFFGCSDLRGKRQAGSGQASRLRSNLFSGFASAIPAPLTRNTLLGSKPASNSAPTHNTSSTSSARRVSKSS